MIEQITLQSAYSELKAKQPHIYAFRAAQALDVSELDIMALELDKSVTLLEGDLTDILAEITNLGKVMALSRNESTVHERKGKYGKLMGKGSPLLFVGKDIDLRIFPNDWKTTLIVEQESSRGTRRSIQFYNSKGLAVHKIFLLEESNLDFFKDLKNKYAASVQALDFIGKFPSIEQKPLVSISEEDQETFAKGWTELKDTHSFYGLYLRYKLQRKQALEYAPEGYAKELKNEDIDAIFKTISDDQMDIMCFVGNGGMIQIHTGKALNLVYKDQWLNILDPDFNLHLDRDKIASIWVVRKPSVDGDIHSFEVFDKEGEMMVQLFGKRKPGIPELIEWTNLTQGYLK